jgi:hypothetical protein
MKRWTKQPDAPRVSHLPYQELLDQKAKNMAKIVGTDNNAIVFRARDKRAFEARDLGTIRQKKRHAGPTSLTPKIPCLYRASNAASALTASSKFKRRRSRTT